MGLASGEAAFTVEGSVVVTAISIQCEAVSSLAAELVHGGDETGAGTTGTGGAGAAIGVVTITDSLMMSSSATSAFRDGGAGAIRTDIMVTTIIPTVTTTTHTVTLDTAGMVITVTADTDAIIRAEITRAVVHRIRVACTTNMHHIING